MKRNSRTHFAEIRNNLAVGIERARREAETSLAAQLQAQIPEMNRADALFNAKRIVERDKEKYLGYSA